MLLATHPQPRTHRQPAQQHGSGRLALHSHSPSPVPHVSHPHSPVSHSGVSRVSQLPLPPATLPPAASSLRLLLPVPDTPLPDSPTDSPSASTDSLLAALSALSALSAPLAAVRAPTLPLSALLSPPFLAHLASSQTPHSQTPQTVALSASAALDLDDAVALVNGVLLLSLSRDSYRACGLEGRPSSADPSAARHVVSIDLLRPGFAPGDPLYDRVAWSFAHVLAAPIDLLLISTSLSDDDDPGMPQGDKVRLVSRDIPLPPSANAYPVPIAFSSTTLSKVHIPVLDDALFSGFGPTPDPRTDLAVDLLEWIGMASIGARRLFAADSCDPFVAIYDPPQPSVVGNLLCVTWNGFIPPAFITLVLSTARSMLKTLPGMSSGDKAGSIPHWGVLCVAGFDDAPVSWNNRDHGYLVNGDNHFATLFTAANQSLSFTMDGGPLPAE